METGTAESSSVTLHPSSKESTDGADEVLVPIRLNFDFGPGKTLDECFTWNLCETDITPEEFAEDLCYDLELGQEHVSEISSSVKRQLATFEKSLHLVRQFQLESSLRSQSHSQGTQRDVSVDNNLVQICINISQEGIHLEDAFEWDIRNDDSLAERFAHVLVADLGLPRTFEVAVAHSIREQVHAHRIAVSHLEDNVNPFGRPVIRTGVRPIQDISKWTPKVYYSSRKNTKRQQNEVGRNSLEPAAALSSIPTLSARESRLLRRQISASMAKVDMAT